MFVMLPLMLLLLLCCNGKQKENCDLIRDSVFHAIRHSFRLSEQPCLYLFFGAAVGRQRAGTSRVAHVHH